MSPLDRADSRTPMDCTVRTGTDALARFMRALIACGGTVTDTMAPPNDGGVVYVRVRLPPDRIDEFRGIAKPYEMREPPRVAPLTMGSTDATATIPPAAVGMEEIEANVDDFCDAEREYAPYADAPANSPGAKRKGVRSESARGALLAAIRTALAARDERIAALESGIRDAQTFGAMQERLAASGYKIVDDCCVCGCNKSVDDERIAALEVGLREACDRWADDLDEYGRASSPDMRRLRALADAVKVGA